MKRIIDGVTYNTDTSTKIAEKTYDATQAGGAQGEIVLYQTRGGAFFLWDHEVQQYRDRNGEWQERITNSVDPITATAAQAWIMDGDTELFSDVFGEPPEAAVSVTPEATLYTRLPASLKDRIETLARSSGLSVNSFAIRCFETCCNAGSVQPQTVARNKLFDAANPNPLRGQSTSASSIAMDSSFNHSATRDTAARRLLQGPGEGTRIPGIPRNRLLPE